MVWRIAMLIAAVAPATLFSSALAQGLPAGGNGVSDSTADVPGYRTSEASGGFRLIDHGIWASGETVDAQRNATEMALPTSPTLPHRATRSPDGAPSGFRRAAYLPHVYAAEARYALPPGLLDALLWTESRYNPFAVSSAGAAGLGQLMPATAAELGVANRFDPLTNLAGAAKYLRRMLDKFGRVNLALAAYNAGPGAVEKAGGVPRNGETPAYVRDVLRHWRF